MHRLQLIRTSVFGFWKKRCAGIAPILKKTLEYKNKNSKTKDQKPEDLRQLQNYL